jgi:hypothetical protein
MTKKMKRSSPNPENPIFGALKLMLGPLEDYITP